VGVCAIYKHFSGFEFFLLPNRIHARPHAGNANRWVAQEQEQNQIRLWVRKFAFSAWRFSVHKVGLVLAVALFKVEFLVNIFSAGRFSSSRLFRLAVFSPLA
jgi:hypothetical protein